MTVASYTLFFFSIDLEMYKKSSNYSVPHTIQLQFNNIRVFVLNLYSIGI